MPWILGEPLADAHRSRLVAAGLEPAALDGIVYHEVTDPLPGWWHELGNALFLRDGFDLPEPLMRHMTTYPFRDALIAIGTDLAALSCLLVGGDGATVYVGPDSYLSAGEIYCGGGSAVILTAGVIGTSRPMIDARNGGSVVAEPDQLWAANAYIATDNMHRLEDLATGRRINPYGAHIHFGRHVWLGRDVVVTGQVDIGDGAVVGMRSLVRGQKVLPNTAVAGTPARVIREGIAWTGDDTR